MYKSSYVHNPKLMYITLTTTSAAMTVLRALVMLGPGSCANMKLVVKEPRGSRHLEHNGCQEAEVYSGHSHSSSSGTNTYCLIDKYKIITQRNTNLNAKQMQKTSFRRQRSTHATTTCHLLETITNFLNGQI